MTWSQRITRPMRLNLRFGVTVDGDRMNGFSKAGRLPSSPVSGVRTSREVLERVAGVTAASLSVHVLAAIG